MSAQDFPPRIWATRAWTRMDKRCFFSGAGVSGTAEYVRRDQFDRAMSERAQAIAALRELNAPRPPALREIKKRAAALVDELEGG